MSDKVRMHATEPMMGFQIGVTELQVHPESQCKGRGIPCCIHSPSDHHMASWPQNWRGDTQVMERLCEHGTGHPDPDHMAYVRSLTPQHDCIDVLLDIHPEYRKDIRGAQPRCRFPHLEWQGVHGCDGCCYAAAADALTRLSEELGDD